MTLEATTEKVWVDNLATQAKVRAALEKRRQQKDAILHNLASQIELARDNVLEKIKGLEASDGEDVWKVLDYTTRDQTTEFDLADQMNGFGFSEEAQRKLTEIGVTLDTLAKSLNTKVKAIDPNTGEELDTEVALFSDEDLKRELYQPIIRQGMMSDTFVADQYSDTAELLKNSMELYKERLDDEGIKSQARENFDLGLGLTKDLVTVVGSSIGFKGIDKDPSKWVPSLEFVKELSEAKPSAIAEVCSTSLELISMGMEGYDTVGEHREGEEERVRSESGPVEGEDPLARQKAEARRVSVAPKVATQLIAAVASGLGSEFKGNNWDLGVSASSAFGAAVKASTVATQLSASPLQVANVTQVRELLKAGFSAAAAACDPGSGAVDDLPASQVIMASVAEKMTSKFETAFDVNAVLAQLNEEKYAEALKAAAEAAKQSVLDGKTVDKLDLLLGDETRLNSAKNAVGMKLTEDFQREINEDVRREQEELAQLTNMAEGQAKASQLAARIRKMEKSESIVNWAASIAGMGIDVAAKFIGPLAIAGSALSLAQNVAKAAKRTRDWYNFYQSEQDMFQAASPFSAPVANFHFNARKQSIHYNINAALDLINMIGAICESVGAAAFGAGVVAGKLIQGVASGAGALESAVYEINKRLDLNKAWEVYRTALENPENRRLGLIALKENPTLAKYAVAWGALVKKDPLVADFLNRCSMTAEELEDPKSKVSEVVKYLELRMPDDNVVVGREVVKSGWAPADNAIVLTASSWIAAKKLGETQARLEVQDTRDLEVALLAFANANAALGQASVKTDYQQARELLITVSTGFNTYRPKLAGQSIEHAEMKKLLDKFKQKVASRLQEIDLAIKQLG